jgi:hypothetical protein
MFYSCKENVEGRKCDACVAGAYQYPGCLTCPCDRTGTEEEICDQVGIFPLDGLEATTKSTISRWTQNRFNYK